MTEPNTYLSAVDSDDKNDVKTIVDVMKRLKIFNEWQVISHPTRLEIIGWFSSSKDICVTLDELDLLEQVNRIRCEGIRVKLSPSSNKHCLSIVYVPHKEPVMVTEERLERAVKKRKSWF